MRIQPRFIGLCAVIMTLMACQDSGRSEPPTTKTADHSADAGVSNGGCPAGELPVVAGKLHGGIAGDLRAMAANTLCSGMARPAARGLRLRFQTASPDGGDTLTLIFGIDALERGDIGSGIRTTVTVIDEGKQRFFSTGDQHNCFSDITKHTESDSPDTTRIDGVVWCTSAVPELNGASSIRMPEILFRGRVAWPGEAA